MAMLAPAEAVVVRLAAVSRPVRREIARAQLQVTTGWAADDRRDA